MNVGLVILLLLIAISLKKPALALILVAVCYPTISLFKIGSMSVVCIWAILFYMYCVLNATCNYDKTKFPFIIPFAICISSYILTHVLHPTTSIFGLVNSMMEYIIVILLWKFYYPCKENNRLFIKIVVIYMLILCSVGLIEAISGNNWFAQYLNNSGIQSALMVDNVDRTGFHRTQSLTIWSESYGTFCIMALCFIFNSANRGFIKKGKLFYFLIAFLLFSIYTTNSRTMIISAIISLGTVIPFFLKNKKQSFLFISLLLVMIFLGGESTTNYLNTFINHESSGGSTIELRFGQFEAVMNIAGSSLWSGHGLNSLVALKNTYWGLYGLESIIFTTILQRGIIGLISVFVLWGYSIKYCFSVNQSLICFLVFSFAVNKLMTLTFGMEETYFLFFLIPLLKQGRLVDVKFKS